MRIQFTFNHQKSIEVVLWILHKNSSIDIYQLMRILFHADLLCLNKYGLPVTGDDYLAMKFGAVPETIYKGLISQDILFLEGFTQDSEIPFKIEKHKITPLRNCNLDFISKANMKCLTASIEEYTNLSFLDAKEKNHSNPAWRKTYNANPNAIIDWYDLIEEQYLKEDLSGGWSELMVI
jgi:uncharacterized phage-associated protein